MNKIMIPSIFVAVLLTAGFLATMPVEKVSAVHTTLLSTLCKALFNLTTCPTTQTTVLSTGGTLGADSITAATIANDAIGATEIANSAIDAATFGAGAIDATAIATDAIGSSELAATAVTEITDSSGRPTGVSTVTIGAAGGDIVGVAGASNERTGIATCRNGAAVVTEVRVGTTNIAQLAGAAGATEAIAFRITGTETLNIPATVGASVTCSAMFWESTIG